MDNQPNDPFADASRSNLTMLRVRKVTRDRVKREARRQGRIMERLVDDLLNDALDTLSRSATH